MNFYSALCLIHPPECLGDLRGHYTEDNTLFARAGTKRLSDFIYQINFNKIFFQTQEVYRETTSQVMAMTENSQRTSLMLLTSNQTHRLQFLREIIRQSEDLCRVYIIDFKRLSREDDYDDDEYVEKLQQLNWEVLERLQSQIKHRRSMNSRSISLKFVFPNKEFIVDLMQTALSTPKDTETLHRLFKQLFEEGLIDEIHSGQGGKELNQSSNITLVSYLSFEEKKRQEEECYLEFLSRLRHSSEVQRLKENRHMESLLSELENLREARDKLSQQVLFYGKTKVELDLLVGKELAIIRRLNIKYSSVKDHKEGLQKHIASAKERIQKHKADLKGKEQRRQTEVSQQSEADDFLERMKSKLTAKLAQLETFDSTGNQNSNTNFSQDSFNRSNGITRPQTALKNKYNETAKAIISTESSKVKSLIESLEEKQRKVLEAKKHEMRNLGEIGELNGLLQQMSEKARSQLMDKYSL